MKAITTEIFKSKFIPAKKSSDKLMIVLHGRGDSIRPFRNFDEELKIYNINYLLLNAPRKFLDGYSWYGEPPYQKDGVIKIREKLIKLLDDLEMQGWRSENIYLLGFSQGCLISADLALNYPKKLGGVIGISGYFHFFPRWKNQLSLQASKTPWLMTHGTKDDVLKLEDTKFGAEKLKNIGINLEWHEIDKDHSMVDEDYPIIRSWIKDKLKNF